MDLTHPRMGASCYSLEEAASLIERLLSLTQVRLLLPTERNWSIFRRLLIEGHAAGRMVTDAQIAAITIEFGGELQTNDRDFTRFPGLRWRNPLGV